MSIRHNVNIMCRFQPRKNLVFRTRYKISVNSVVALITIGLLGFDKCFVMPKNLAFLCFINTFIVLCFRKSFAAFCNLIERLIASCNASTASGHVTQDAAIVLFCCHFNHRRPKLKQSVMNIMTSLVDCIYAAMCTLQFLPAVCWQKSYLGVYIYTRMHM